MEFGRRTPARFPWSATSMAGTRNRILCGRAAVPASGKALCPESAKARCTSTTLFRTIRDTWARKPIRLAFFTKNLRAPPRWCGTWNTSGPTSSGWKRAGQARFAAGADFGLRSASGFVDAGPGRGRPAADLPRNRAAAGGIRQAHEFYPRGIDAHHGASFLRVVGLSDHGIFCAHFALRHAAGFHVPGGLSAPAWHRRDSGLGAVALPYRRARAGLFRRHASVTSTPTRARAFIPTGRLSSSTTAATKCAAF